jgi:hypothetical protein
MSPVSSNTALAVSYLNAITPSRPIPPEHPSFRHDGRQNGDKCVWSGLGQSGSSRSIAWCHSYLKYYLSFGVSGMVFLGGGCCPKRRELLTSPDISNTVVS